MSHYIVGYHDQERKHHEIGEYAEDAFEAIQHAKEDVPFLHDHPSYVDDCHIEKEEPKIAPLGSCYNFKKLEKEGYA